MAFEGLADKLGNAFKKLKSKGKLTESDVKEAMREVRSVSYTHLDVYKRQLWACFKTVENMSGLL